MTHDDGVGQEGSGDVETRPVDAAQVDWLALVQAGRFGEAMQALRMVRAVGGPAGTEPAAAGDDVDLDAVAALADLEASLLGKDWRGVERKLDGLPDEVRDRWAAWLPAMDVERHVRALAESGAALDARNPDEAEPVLDGLEDSPLASLEAERAAQWGTLSLMRGEDEAARAAFERALERNAKHLRALVNLGNVFLEQGAVDEAIERYEAALSVDEEYASALHNLGVAYRRAGQVGKSVRTLRRAASAQRKRDVQEARRVVTQRSGGRQPRPWRWLAILAVGTALVAWFVTR